MDSKTYGVKIVALTDGFKNKMNEIKTLASKTSDNIKQSFNKFKDQGIQTNIGESLENDVVKIQRLKSEIRTLKAEMNSLSPNDSVFAEYAMAIDSAERELKQLVSQQRKAKASTSSLNIETSKMKATSNLFNQMTKKITRYGLALFSVRSIFSVVSRASSAYLAQDTDLAGKLQSVWAGLGAFLAPIIEKIANMMIRLVSYLNMFIKAVSGQDLLAKASKKATDNIKKQTKATKGLNKALSGLDEITNVQDDSANGGTPEIENPFANFETDQELPFATKIKEFGEWVKTNWPFIVAGLSGLATALLGVKLAMSGGTVGAFGQTLIGVGVAVMGVVGALKHLKEYIDLVDKGLEDTKEGWQTFWDMMKFIGIAVAGVGIAIGSIPVIVTGAVIAIVSVIAKYWDQIKKGINKALDWIEEKIKWLFGDTLGDIIMAPFRDAVDIIISIFDGLFKGVKQIIDGIIKIFKGDFKEGLASIGKGIANVLIGLLNGLISSLNLFLTPFRSIIVLIGKAMGKNLTMGDVKLPKVPLLEVGTNYVPEDQLAYIHKGEAVIPKKFNSAEYFNQGNNNDDVKALLTETNSLLARIEEKDNNTYLDGKEIGKSTVSYIKKQNRILGRSVLE